MVVKWRKGGWGGRIEKKELDATRPSTLTHCSSPFILHTDTSGRKTPPSSSACRSRPLKAWGAPPHHVPPSPPLPQPPPPPPRRRTVDEDDDPAVAAAARAAALRVAGKAVVAMAAAAGVEEGEEQEVEEGA